VPEGGFACPPKFGCSGRSPIVAVFFDSASILSYEDSSRSPAGVALKMMSLLYRRIVYVVVLFYKT
jgi:hypothetical protein